MVASAAAAFLGVMLQIIRQLMCACVVTTIRLITNTRCDFPVNDHLPHTNNVTIENVKTITKLTHICPQAQSRFYILNACTINMLGFTQTHNNKNSQE